MHNIIRGFLVVIITTATLRLIFFHRFKYDVAYDVKNPSSLKNFIVWPDEGPKIDQLMDLRILNWPNFQRSTIVTVKQFEQLDSYDIKMSVGQYATTEYLLTQFTKAMLALKLQNQWFLCARSLLGSIQHHDMVPWDDEIDVCLHVKERFKVREALRGTNPMLEVGEMGQADKFFYRHTNKSAVMNRTMIEVANFTGTPWPFLSISYISDVNANEIMVLDGEKVIINSSYVFPLTYRPFGQHWYPAPRKPVSFLSRYYATKTPMCSSQSFSRALNKPLGVKYKDCRSLMETYPIVHRCHPPKAENVQNIDQYCDEHLVDGNGRSLHKIRTALQPDQWDMPFHSTMHESFSCPL